MLITMTFEDLYRAVYPDSHARHDRKEFAKSLFTDDILTMLPLDRDDSTWRRLFNRESKRCWPKVASYLRGKTDSSYQTCPDRIELMRKWGLLLEKTEYDPVALRQTLRDKIGKWFPLVPPQAKGSDLDADNCISLRQRLNSLTATYPLAEVLADLTLVAITLQGWPASLLELSEDDTRFFNLFLPPLAEESTTDYAAELRRGIKMYRKGKADAIGHLLLAAQSMDATVSADANYWLYEYYQWQKDMNTARTYLFEAARKGHANAKELSEVLDKDKNPLFSIQKSFADSSIWNNAQRLFEKSLKILGEPHHVTILRKAAWNVYHLINLQEKLDDRPKDKESWFRLPENDTPEAYLRLAYHWGAPEAQEEVSQLDQKEAERITPSYESCVDTSSGVFHIAAPEGSELSEIIRKTAPLTWHAADSPLPKGLVPKHTRHFFLSDAEQTNLDQALNVLQQSADDKSVDPFHCQEIYIRGNSEHLQALVDTAVSSTGDAITPIHILDDAKWAAQSLLFDHPLFYPLYRQSTVRKPTLNFVVIGNSETAGWLVREAFALMGFRRAGISCRITVIAPQAETFKNKLEHTCPGLKEDALKGISIQHSELAYIDVSAYEASDFDDAIRAILALNGFPYFAISTGGDDTLRIAMSLREIIIREVVATIRNPKAELPALDHLPPIAFHCQNENVAHLSRRMVACNEAYGRQWFNNWDLIPFGMPSGRYSWRNLDGLLDRLAMEVHLQYADTSSQKELDAAKRDYYRWQYNQDSSMAVALSMPYRLFQFTRKDKMQLVPPRWQLRDAYMTPYSLEALEKLLCEQVPYESKKEIDEMAQWEQERWTRWMISRGWLPNSAEQAACLMHNGNGRQQLYIARLHPGMGSYAGLAHVQDVIGKDFKRYNKESIRLTSVALRKALGLTPQREKEEERDDH